MKPINGRETTETLDIHHIEQLSTQAGIPVQDIEEIRGNIQKHSWGWYRPEYKPDGTVKKKRKITSPSPELGIVLVSNDCLLSRIKVHTAMHSGRKGFSCVSNARDHVKQKYVLNIDIEDFFPHITSEAVYKLFLRRLCCSSRIARLLTTLCTAKGRLPQGYNTSPRIANLVLLPAIKRIDGLCKKQGLKLSVYADDITISGNRNPKRYLPTIKKILKDYGFRINDKTKHCRYFERQKVTGVVVNEKLNIDKRDYRKVRAMIHICQKYGFTEFVGKLTNRKGDVLDTVEKVIDHLKGKLSNFSQINAERVKKLKENLEEAIALERATV